ncbi:hypothetical protein [Roseovarius sp.]|uniref:hypothetical protein n=1 Tax=Roseovarius sp. TaxID=1486281 RepID=UPI003B5BC0B7
MTAAEIIGRAVFAARPFCWSNTGIDLSTMSCAALETEGIYYDGRGIFWVAVGRDGRNTIPCEMKLHLPGAEAIVHCMNFDIWHGDLCRSAHERLAVEAKVWDFVSRTL